MFNEKTNNIKDHYLYLFIFMIWNYGLWLISGLTLPIQTYFPTTWYYIDLLFAHSIFTEILGMLFILFVILKIWAYTKDRTLLSLSTTYFNSIDWNNNVPFLFYFQTTFTLLKNSTTSLLTFFKTKLFNKK